MRFRVSHHSRYDYDVPVSLGVHHLRLFPRARDTRVIGSTITVDPVPVTGVDLVDESGHITRQVHFEGTTRYLEINSHLDVEVFAPAPMEGSLPPLPWGAAGDGLEPYRAHAWEPEVAAYATQLREECGPDPVMWLDGVARALFTRMDRHIRPTGAARTASETLAVGAGACRDLTVLFLALCRSQGLAARFVSGYQARAQTPDGQRHLHAWAEVYLGALGWRGWDPMHGVRVDDGHLALSAAAEQSGTMPIDGGYTFVGPVVNSTLTHSVRIATD